MPDQKKLDDAYRWLQKAVDYESEGKSEKMVDMAFKKALSLENEAFTESKEAA